MERGIIMKKYIGHEQQIYGVMEATLTAGKANGMRVLFVRNGSGLEFTVSVDRCADLSRITFKSISLAETNIVLCPPL